MGGFDSPLLPPGLIPIFVKDLKFTVTVEVAVGGSAPDVESV